MSKGKWISILAAWEGENDYGQYIMIKPEDGYELVLLKDGEQVETWDAKRSLFINENQYKDDNPKAPSYKLLKKSYTESDKVEDYIADDVADDVPF